MQLSGRDEPWHTEQLANACKFGFTGSPCLGCYEVLTFPMLTNSCAEHWSAICVQTCKHTKMKSLIESLPRSGTRPLTCPGGALETAQPRSPPSSMLPARQRVGLLTLQLMEFRVSRWGAGLKFNSPHPCPSLPMSSNLAPYFRIMMGSFPPWTALPPMSKCPRLRLKGVNPRTTDPSKNREGTEGSNRST